MENVELNLKQTARKRRKNNETRTTKGGGKNQFERGQKIKLKMLEITSVTILTSFK